MNTADDMQNPGPDFQTGFGHVNARRAFEVIRFGQHENNFVSQGSSQQHTITVPATLMIRIFASLNQMRRSKFYIFLKERK